MISAHSSFYADRIGGDGDKKGREKKKKKCTGMENRLTLERRKKEKPSFLLDGTFTLSPLAHTQRDV